MNSEHSQWNDFDPALLDGAGVYRHAIAEIAPVEQQSVDTYNRWIADGCNGTMDYLRRYGDVRSDPRRLLEGARSIICLAIPYWSPDAKSRLPIARYALGRDYHEELRQRLNICAEKIQHTYGGTTRVCIDTAPLRERYWALRSGLGMIGLNNQLIIPGAGSYFFLAFILTSAPLRPTPIHYPPTCQRCGRCVRACPTGALHPDGHCDASRCLSYLTIEHRGDFPPDIDLHGQFYGCDRCAQACPHNLHPVATTIQAFTPNPAICDLTPDDILAMDQPTFSAIFRHSPMKRAKLAGLQRNIRALRRKI